MALAAVGLATVVTACDKPRPAVTFQSGSRSVVVTPLRYCFELDEKTCHTTDGRVDTTLRAQAGSAINISVPRTVALNAWIATAYTVGADGKNTALDGFGSNLVVDEHDSRVFVPTRTGSYLLAVNEVRGDTQTGTWTVKIEISNSA